MTKIQRKMESMIFMVTMKKEIPQRKDQLPVHKEDDMPHNRYYLNTVSNNFVNVRIQLLSLNSGITHINNDIHTLKKTRKEVDIQSSILHSAHTAPTRYTTPRRKDHI